MKEDRSVLLRTEEELLAPASALPNATCLAATFDDELVKLAGSLLAEETKARNAVCLLAPTINIQRSPLGGRAFESFSEDPTHSGLIAASYVNGLQGGGVSATIKHFVTNDQEHERMGQDSIVSPRALREIYLRPFQIAVKHSRPWAFMTAYNKLNGTHCAENEWLLQQVLRKEWGHEGLIMSDWYGTYSVSEGINAGLDLEMPGPTNWRDQKLVSHLISAHKINTRQINKVAGEVLSWVQKLAKANEGLVYAAPSEEKTRMEAKEADSKLLRRLGTEGMVLLKNEKSVLPIKEKKIAVIGPNAKSKVLTGGGSAQLQAAWSQSPWEGLVANKPQGTQLDYSLGAQTSKFLPVLGEDFTCLDGSPGFDLRHYAVVDEKQASQPTIIDKWHTSDMLMADFYHPDLGKQWFTEIEAVLTSPIDGEYEFGICVTGKGWVWVDGEMIIDNSKDQVRGTVYFGNGTDEVKGRIKVEKGKVGCHTYFTRFELTLISPQKYTVKMLHDSRRPVLADAGETTPFICAMRLGAFPVFHPDQAITDAVILAKSSDVAVIIAGLNADWESEGYDRPDLSLPLKSDELITKVAEANSNTVVVIQAGSAVSMPWIDKVAGVVYAWYGGNECGNSIADIVYGNVNPSGRLPLSFPKTEKDIAANLNYKSARTKIHYEEGIWVGYKHFNARGIEPLFPFGHGLSYTTFEYSDLKISSSSKAGAKADDWKVGVSVKVTNTGKVKGSHSVHLYTCPPPESSTGLRHPEQTLQGYRKVQDLAPGESETVEVILDKCGWFRLTARAKTESWARRCVTLGRGAQDFPSGVGRMDGQGRGGCADYVWGGDFPH